MLLRKGVPQDPASEPHQMHVRVHRVAQQVLPQRQEISPGHVQVRFKRFVCLRALNSLEVNWEYGSAAQCKQARTSVCHGRHTQKKRTIHKKKQYEAILEVKVPPGVRCNPTVSDCNESLSA